LCGVMPRGHGAGQGTAPCQGSGGPVEADAFWPVLGKSEQTSRQPEESRKVEDASCPAPSSETPVESGQASAEKAGHRGQAAYEHEHKQEDADTAEEPERAEAPRNKRGAKHGHKGHGRRIPNNLPEEHIVIRVPDELRVCPGTGEEGESLPPSSGKYQAR